MILNSIDMINLLEFYTELGFNICNREPKFFTGNITNKEGITLSVIHTGETHRLNCEKNGMFCQIIPNSTIEFTDVDLVKTILSISIFLKGNFPNIFQQILLLNTEKVE
ncbi:hypothetical protein BXQ17_07915 [Polaribacter sp. BM10]|nr:hypothetical protein BXQ17_07915 [Polaribacter sp. BM10]